MRCHSQELCKDMNHRCDWVPSHNKYPEWCPPVNRLLPIQREISAASLWTASALHTLASSSKRLLEHHGITATLGETPVPRGSSNETEGDSLRGCHCQTVVQATQSRTLTTEACPSHLLPVSPRRRMTASCLTQRGLRRRIKMSFDATVEWQHRRHRNEQISSSSSSSSSSCTLWFTQVLPSFDMPHLHLI